MKKSAFQRIPAWLVAGTLVCSSLWAGAQSAASAPKRGQPESVWLLTASQKLVNIHPAQPGKALKTVRLNGLLQGDELVGIDYRVAKGMLYGLGRSGALYLLEPVTGSARLVNPEAQRQPLGSGPVGFDFNPVADRIRVVQSNGDNRRLHPDTAAVIDFAPQTEGLQTDPKLSYTAGDVNAGQAPDVVAAAYTYNPDNDKITTNYAIDRRLGVLVIQGSKEGVQPVVSPNLGLLTTVGTLGLGPLQDASFDISDVGNVALAVVSTDLTSLPRLVRIDLNTGAATLVGSVAGGEPVAGMAIEP